MRKGMNSMLTDLVWSYFITVSWYLVFLYYSNAGIFLTEHIQTLKDGFYFIIF